MSETPIYNQMHHRLGHDVVETTTLGDRRLRLTCTECAHTWTELREEGE